MSWNYRIVKTKVGKEVRYGIHEVYYNSRGKPRSYTLCSIALDVFGRELMSRTRNSVTKALREQLYQMRAALDQPILTEADFKKKK